jgi:hypothetical protein
LLIQKKKSSSVQSILKAECAPCVQWKMPLLKQEANLLAASRIWYQDNAKWFLKYSKNPNSWLMCSSSEFEN